MIDGDELERSIKTMKEKSTWFWTREIIGNSKNKSLSELLNTRSEFQKILENSTPENVVESLLKNNKNLGPKMAIIHLMMASDCSGEFLDRIKTYIQEQKITKIHIEKSNKDIIEYEILEMNSCDTTRLTNKKIIDSNSHLMKDMMTIILFGSMIKEFKNFINFKKLKMGKIIGDCINIRKYFEELYIITSRQTQGKMSNDAGAALGILVNNKLKNFFKEKKYFAFVNGNRIPNIGPNKKGLQVDKACTIKTINKSLVYVAIEIAFQETTNSVIERKSKQATALRKEFDKNGHHLCFVVDGGGYFTRVNAFKDIVKYAHKAVTIKQLDDLCEYIDAIH